MEISSGFTITAYLLITTVITIKFFITKKINLLIIFLIIASALLTNTLKYEIRNKTWDYIGQNQLKKGNQNNQILKNLNETKEIYLNNDSKNIFDKNNLLGQESRLFHSNISLQITLARTPSEIEYYEGKSYAAIPYKIIPSFLIKNKPIEEWGNFWGHRYSVLNQNDYQTSWNYPVLNEFYANFSIKGVVIGMFFLGFIIKVLLIFFSFNFKQPVLLSMSSAIMLNFFFLENNLSLIIGSVINQILFFSIIIFLMCLHNFLLKQISNLK